VAIIPAGRIEPMAKKDPRIDRYIQQSAAFAKPILKHLRKLVHTAVPDVEEDMKWSAPHFLHTGMLCSMASFKNHCAFGFWKADLVLGSAQERDGAGHLGRISSLSDLPTDDVIVGYVRKAAALNEQGVKVERKPPSARKPLEVPPDLTAALRKNKIARQVFDAFSYSHRKEYVEWLTESRTQVTRQKRLDTAIRWLAEGKTRNWKYVSAR
jgi:uncharacterized protein YdeI (YjbR/CyaY-like superfamily)